jgi:D-alanine-D-alanine ligase-like ATP-grasp enzyme
MNRHGEPYVLEINPLPSLSPEDIFYTVGNYLGVGYNRMILDILDAAFERCGI